MALQLPEFVKRNKFLRQYTALVNKHALVAYRNPRATALQLAAVILFMLMLLIVDRALQADDRRSTEFKNIRDPAVEYIGNIPTCFDDLYLSEKDWCHDLVYTPNTSDVARAIVDGMIRNNVPKLQNVVGFANLKDANAYLLKYPERAISAVHFTNLENVDVLTTPNIEYGLQVNQSTKYFKGTFQDPNFFARIPVQAAVEREAARYIARATGQPEPKKWRIGYSEFAHPALDPQSIAGIAAGNFIFAAALFGFVLQLGDLVYEKEKGLRQALRTMGMSDSAYWLSWLTWQVVINFLSTIALIVTGLIMQFDIFIENDFGISFMVIFLFEMAMTGMAVPLSAMVKKSQTATNLGFIIFLVGWIIQIVIAFGFPYTTGFWYQYDGVYPGVFSWMPWALLSKGLTDMGKATATKELPGLKWSERHSYCMDYSDYDLSDARNAAIRSKCIVKGRYIDCDCVMPLDWVMGFNTVLFVGYFILGIYLDNVLPNENGVSRPLYYFLDPNYWFPRVNSRAGVERVMNGRGLKLMPGETNTSTDEDVEEEEKKMTARLGQLREGDTTEHDRHAIELFNLRKVFKTRGRAPFVAVKGSWFSIERGTLFCLLGPNGAGKTTTINMLTGVLPPTAGEALIYGESLSSSGGIDRIRSMMGVCPQFDVLWDRLTGREHLSLYGAIKGVHDTEGESARLLETVKLTDAGDLRTIGYSGGMKRRLSVAIALLGDPKVVYLDEPTTGMDPISRRYVWDIIESVKKQRAIILTTHSMEEAEILGDRIAIMARGKLQCLGNSVRLKTKFGAGYNLAISVTGVAASVPQLAGMEAAANPRVAAVKEYVQQTLGLTPFDETRAYLFYLLPRGVHERLPSFLRDLEGKSSALGIADVQLSMTSLEEVFLNIAKKAEMEAARTGNAFVTAYLRDGTAVQVPMGSDYAALNGVTYTVKWAQDESGNLMVADMQPMDPALMQQHGMNGGFAAPAPQQQGFYAPPPQQQQGYAYPPQQQQQGYAYPPQQQPSAYQPMEVQGQPQPNYGGPYQQADAQQLGYQPVQGGSGYQNGNGRPASGNPFKH